MEKTSKKIKEKNGNKPDSSANSLAKSLFAGLLHKVRNRGIPKQSGFLHLNKVKGYGMSTATTTFDQALKAEHKPIDELNLLKSNEADTKQAIQRACEKERRHRLRFYFNHGIPNHRPFGDFLDEFQHLVRDAERRECEEDKKSKSRSEWTWASVMEEIQRRGLAKNIERQMEAQRQVTIADIKSSADNSKNAKEISYEAAVHENKAAVQREVQKAVQKWKDFSKSESEAIDNYYSDLKEQFVHALHSKCLALQLVEQTTSAVKERLNDEIELADDLIRLRTIERRQRMHKELLEMFAIVVKQRKTLESKMVKAQVSCKDGVLEEISQSYWKKKATDDFARAKVEKVRRDIREPQTQSRQNWNRILKEVRAIARQRLATQSQLSQPNSQH